MNNWSFVFLNYGDPLILESAIKSLLENKPPSFSCFNIVVVDNFTSEQNRNSIRALRDKYSSMPFHVIFNKENLGYGAGNNCGLRYSFEVLSADIAIVLNTDITFVDFTEFDDSSLLCEKPVLYTFTVFEGLNDITLSTFSENTFRSKSASIPIIKEVYPSGCCWGMNRSMWDASSGFVESHFLYFEELEFVYRYKKNNYCFPAVKHIASVAIVHAQGATTGISKDVSKRSLSSEFWSARSRILFCKSCIPLKLHVAILYNLLLSIHRLIKLSPGHALAIYKATVSGLLASKAESSKKCTGLNCNRSIVEAYKPPV